jgi:hypothetical protein
MYSPVSNNAILVLGDTGCGKTASLRHLDPNRVLLIQTVPKKLPFPCQHWLPFGKDAAGKMVGSIYVTDNSDHIVQAIKLAPSWGKDIVIIDDFQYLMVNEFMRKAEVKGFEKFTVMARHAWDVIVGASNCDARIRVYLLAHIQTGDDGKQRIKTVGKLIDEKVIPEGYLTTVLKAVFENGKYCFKTKTNGHDTVKAPMGMFENEYLDNDLNLVDQIYTNFYNIH